jgi:hypothetical protein
MVPTVDELKRQLELGTVICSRDQNLRSRCLLRYFEPTLILLKAKDISEHKSCRSPIPMNMEAKGSLICKLGVDLASDNIQTSTCPTEKITQPKPPQCSATSAAMLYPPSVTAQPSAATAKCP